MWMAFLPICYNVRSEEHTSELHQLEEYLVTNKKEITVYAVVNCGFYEGRQNSLAIAMMENWCHRAGLRWGQGLGIGAGGMLAGIRNVPLGSGPKKNLGRALEQLRPRRVCS